MRLASEIDSIKYRVHCAVLWLSACQVEGQKAQSTNHSISFFFFVELFFSQLICHGRQLSLDIKLSSWHFVYPANRLCHLERVAVEMCKGWRRHMSLNPGQHMTFLGHFGNQATTPMVQEPRNGGKKGNNPFVPVTPLVLIPSQRPGLCGKLISNNTCLFETDGWFSWGVIDVFFFSLYLCVWTCVQCICSLLSLFDGLIWVPFFHQRGVLFRVAVRAPTALWVIRSHQHKQYPKYAIAVKGVAPS